MKFFIVIYQNPAKLEKNPVLGLFASQEEVEVAIETLVNNEIFRVKYSYQFYTGLVLQTRDPRRSDFLVFPCEVGEWIS